MNVRDDENRRGRYHVSVRIIGAHHRRAIEVTAPT
jgi:hypothetical protein